MPEEVQPNLAQAAEKPRLPGLFRNLVSWIGSGIALIALVNILFVLMLELFGVTTNPYVGILAYMVLPAFLILGLALIPMGMLLERRRRRRHLGDVIPAYPRIDLNLAHHRNAFAFFLISLLAFLSLSAVGSYRAYEYTETTQFCGQVCHSVMHPEFIAYQASPHARVRCVDCHVGPGATFYVKSKLSGAYQLYAVAFHKFPRPIPTPVANLRPAQETCEQCHWPERFYGAQLKVITHFGSDEANTPRQIRMLIKTGGGSPAAGLTTGIHWHMNIANEVTYVATDPQRQNIPWVRIKDQQGRITEYLQEGSEVKPEQIQSASKRRMDCVDCHNRPSHIYYPPARSVDEYLLAGKIDRTLPFIRQQAVEVLAQTYDSSQQAREAIATTLDRFYLTKYPDLHKSRLPAVQRAIAGVQQIHATTMFPEMKVDWRTHPDNIGHYYYPGCFRCHDGQHKSPEGKVISKDCEVCHVILGQEEGGQPMASVPGTAFQHPVDLGDLSAVTCTDCHSGGTGP